MEDEQQACVLDPFCLGMCDWTDCPIQYKPHPVLLPLPSEPLPSLLASSEPHPSPFATRAPLLSNSPPLPPLLPVVPLQPVSSSGIQQRFSFVSEDEAQLLEIGYKPPNTSKNTKWALKNFEEWRMARNSSVPNDEVPPSLLTDHNPIQLNKWLSRFVIETRKNKGKQYPPSTIHQLLTGILRHMRESNPQAPNFLDKKNPTFRGLHGTLDNLFCFVPCMRKGMRKV